MGMLYSALGFLILPEPHHSYPPDAYSGSGGTHRHGCGWNREVHASMAVHGIGRYTPVWPCVVYSDWPLSMSEQSNMLNITLFWNLYSSEILNAKSLQTAASFPFQLPYSFICTIPQFFNLTPTPRPLILLHPPDLSSPLLSSSSPCPALNPRLITLTVQMHCPQ